MVVIYICTGAYIIIHFTAVINQGVKYASAFAIVSHFLLALTNTLAFYVMELIKDVISFMIHAPDLRGLYCHSVNCT